MKILHLFLITIILSTFSSKALAEISLSIKNEEFTKTKILFFGFDDVNPQIKADSSEIFERIRKNLKTTDLFEIIKQNKTTMMPGYSTAGTSFNTTNGVTKNSLNPSSFDMNADLSIESLPVFEKYSQAGIGAIIVAQFNYDKIGNLELRIRMWDVLDQRQLFGKFYTASKDNYRKIANAVSDEIFKAITGEKIGHFNSQILYVSESGSAKKRTKKINLIDFDGENHRVLTDGYDLVLTPVFSGKRGEIFYVRYFDGKPQIFSLDIRNLRSKKLSNFRSTTFAAAVNPKDPNLILCSAIFDGNSDIYEINIAKNEAKRLTKSSAIDTTPSYSPNGKLIAFSSDREAGQKIYVMDADGSSVKRITSGPGSYSKPVWSPDGKSIAFTKIKDGNFFIGIMSANGANEKLLTTGYLVEGARWSPNGRYLIFAKKKTHYGQGSVSRLGAIDVVTGFEFEIPTPEGEGATDPDWI